MVLMPGGSLHTTYSSPFAVAIDLHSCRFHQGRGGVSLWGPETSLCMLLLPSLNNCLSSCSQATSSIADFV